MKTLRLFLIFAFAFALAGTASITLTSCTATQQVTTVRTLEAVGIAAKAGMDSAAILYHNSQITVAQYTTIANFYDNKFQPAFDLAKAAAKADVTSFAPADVEALATQFAALVASYQPSKS